MTISLPEIENRAGIVRTTCGWKKQHLPLDAVRRYWRDVHSPAIARRAGVYDYRHSQYGDVRSDLFAQITGVSYVCKQNEQLMWLSDVRYVDQQALDLFANSPSDEAKADLLGDIDILVDRSSTYKAVGNNAHTYVDNTGNRTPLGPPALPTFSVFFRQRGDEAGFNLCLRTLSQRWSITPGVLRVRLTLFEAPDMEAEKKAGYPIKTHPIEQQYQAWIELIIADEQVAKKLLTPGDGVDNARHIAEIHAYPVIAMYTYVYGGRPTLAGLRGYAAYESIKAFNAVRQEEPRLLEWMYGPIAQGGPVKDGEL